MRWRNELYDAELIGVEELRGKVEAAMVRFRRKFYRVPGAPEEDLEQLALQLSHACEVELRASQDSLLEQHKTIANLLTINVKP